MTEENANPPTPQPVDENGNPILPPQDENPDDSQDGEQSAGADNGSTGDEAEKEPAPKAPTAGEPSNEAKPKAHTEGGATLSPSAVTPNPVLIATVEVYRREAGDFVINFTNAQGNTYPQMEAEDIAGALGEIEGAFNIALAA